MNKKMKVTFIAKIITSVLLCGLILVMFDCQREQQANDPVKQGNNQTAVDNKAQSANKKNLVEIFYLPHPPAQAIVQKVEAILKKYPQFGEKKYDFFDAANKRKIADYNLVEHSPIVIFINGESVFTIGNRTVSLKNFPKGDAFVPSFEGDWSYDDFEQLLK